MQQMVKILGARGSVPVSGEAFRRYGSAATCVFLRLAGQPMVLDAEGQLLTLMARSTIYPLNCGLSVFAFGA